MAKGNWSVEVDGYIAKAKPFAQPILTHLRELVHKGCPEVEETMKWSMPFFVYKGANLGNMAGFKAHCSFGFWGKEMSATLREAGLPVENAAGSLGRLASLEDLPADKQMVAWIKQAAGLIATGASTSPMAGRTKMAKAAKPEVEMPLEFAAALKEDTKAAGVFAGFSPSCKREYVEWIAEAKRAETKEKRIVQAVAWIGEGKQRNWRYQER